MSCKRRVVNSNVTNTRTSRLGRIEYRAHLRKSDLGAAIRSRIEFVGSIELHIEQHRAASSSEGGVVNSIPAERNLINSQESRENDLK